MRSMTNGEKTVVVAANTVAEVIDRLDEMYPGIKKRLCDGDGLRSGIAVAVDTQLATLGLRQSVNDDSEVHFLPAISGGGLSLLFL